MVDNTRFVLYKLYALHTQPSYQAVGWHLAGAYLPTAFYFLSAWNIAGFIPSLIITA